MIAKNTRIVVNADDFGLTKGINQGIIEAFRKGIVKSASLMSVGMAYNDAVMLIKENPGLDIGIHLCLTKERPLLKREEIPSLIRKDGHFLSSHLGFVLKFILGKSKRAEIEKEFDAQIKRPLEAGIKITHIDSHGYIHMLPKILKVVMRLAKRYDIPFIRYPCERLEASDTKLSRKAIGFIINMFCILTKQNFKNGFLSTPNFYGFLYSGCLSIKEIKKILESAVLKGGVTELVCHPGIYNSELSEYKDWGYCWEKELKALTSPDINNLIWSLNIKVISFKDLL